MLKPAILIQHCTRDFNDVRAIDTLSLNVPYDCIFGLLGPRGAGKTTVLRLLLGSLKPSAGQVQVLGSDPCTHAKNIRPHLGALLSDDGLYEHLSAMENLAFYGRIWRMSKGAVNARARRTLKLLNLWQHRHELVGAWSRGKRQKLAMARAVLHRPKLLLLDEPTADLDAHSAREIQRLVISMAREEAMTIFLATTSAKEVERLCSHAAVLQDGKVVAMGTLGELNAHDGSPHLDFLGRGFDLQCLEILRTHPDVVGAQLGDDHLSVYLSHHQSDTAPLIDLLQQAGAQVDAVRECSTKSVDGVLPIFQEDIACKVWE